MTRYAEGQERSVRYVLQEDSQQAIRCHFLFVWRYIEISIPWDNRLRFLSR